MYNINNDLQWIIDQGWDIHIKNLRNKTPTWEIEARKLNEQGMIENCIFCEEFSVPIGAASIRSKIELYMENDKISLLGA
jgi:hypothetical protein